MRKSEKLFLGFAGVCVVVAVSAAAINSFSSNPIEQTRPGSSKTTSEPTNLPAPIFQVSNPVLSGDVIPFQIVQATHKPTAQQHGDAYISVMVKGGSKGDWAATALYLAQVARSFGFETGKVEVSQENPWKDSSPTEYKTLGEVYYGNSDDTKDDYAVFAADKMAPAYLIEYDEYSSELGETIPSNSSESALNRLNKKIDDASKSYIIKKYQLPNDWEPPINNPFGAGGSQIMGSQIQVKSIQSLQNIYDVSQCLTSIDGAQLIKGCLSKGDENYILPAEQRRPPVNFSASNFMDSDIPTTGKCSDFSRFLTAHKHPSSKDASRNAIFFTMLMFGAGVDVPTIKQDYLLLLSSLILECERTPASNLIDATKRAAYDAGMSTNTP